MTNRFVIRDSAHTSHADKHLAVPSNGFLTARGSHIARIPLALSHGVSRGA
jgi:hypothetical protein